jgi:D-serine deaminase-like pyridoxal phosphate-dependent protein
MALDVGAEPTQMGELDTPSVIVDLDLLEQNIAEMAELARAAGVALRPHIKTHKTPEIARMQLAAGAVGVTCAKLGEAEALADAGLEPGPYTAETYDVSLEEQYIVLEM